MFDTAAVAELIWDHYLAPSVQNQVRALVGGSGGGRQFFVWLCGIHDLGKATPAFQHMDADGAAAVRAAGLSWDRFAVKRHRWRHEKAGAILAMELLAESGWPDEQCGWVWPLIAGHHGVFPADGELGVASMAKMRGSGDWVVAQRALIESFTRELGFTDVAAVAPVVVPNRALQLQLSGFVVMADWIASDEKHFVGIDDLAAVALEAARIRAVVAWEKLGLRRGWGLLPEPSVADFARRFGDSPRDSQRVAIECAARIPQPGLIVVEAPMGEGKTKAALMMAEVLAARFGMDGVFVGMPTQATSDPMFSSVRRWLSNLGADLADQVVLLHGKRRFNKEWQRLLDNEDDPDSSYSTVGEDDFDMPDPYGCDACAVGEVGRPQRSAPAEWFLGGKRGLLAPFAVGTIDQLLIAATRSRHVMLRMAGLAGKVVILDEVHAADVYMSQFLGEGLRWLAQAGIPVVLLSATLTARQRRELVESYLAGALGAERPNLCELPDAAGYPRITTAWVGDDGETRIEADTARPWRSIDLGVEVEVLHETDSEPSDPALVHVLTDRLVDGGCALVVRNSVARAQRTFAVLREVFGADVRLLHGRMHVRHRADRTAECLELLGPPGDGRRRPRRSILVATQIAEQSFDVDVDLLVTDLAPMDLLLQRIGRMHRHDGLERPPLLRTPTVIVTGFAPRPDTGPSFVSASENIYGSWPLLRAAAAVESADTGWVIPSGVPGLVHTAYDPKTSVPSGWEARTATAYDEWEKDRRSRASAAARYLLTRLGEHTRPTLDGLHRLGGMDAPDDQVFVRDGDKTLEVVLVRHDGSGYRTMTGRWLGAHGEASPDLLDDLLGGTVRLPASLIAAATDECRPLDGWRDHPWLRYSRALILRTDGAATLGAATVRYDNSFGLIIE